MTGYKEERKPGVWSLVVYLGRDAQGKKKQKWHTFKGGERAAQRELNRLLSAIDSGEYVAPTKQTVSAFLVQWLTDYAQSAVRPTT
ncbi:MAG: site-specific integrase, partial [Actinomycetota bacterium]